MRTSKIGSSKEKSGYFLERMLTSRRMWPTGNKGPAGPARSGVGQPDSAEVGVEGLSGTSLGRRVSGMAKEKAPEAEGALS